MFSQVQQNEEQGFVTTCEKSGDACGVSFCQSYSHIIDLLVLAHTFPEVASECLP